MEIFFGRRLTLEQCVKMLSRPKVAGKSYRYPVMIIDYHCKKRWKMAGINEHDTIRKLTRENTGLLTCRVGEGIF